MVIATYFELWYYWRVLLLKWLSTTITRTSHMCKILESWIYYQLIQWNVDMFQLLNHIWLRSLTKKSKSSISMLLLSSISLIRAWFFDFEKKILLDHHHLRLMVTNVFETPHNLKHSYLHPYRYIRFNTFSQDMSDHIVPKHAFCLRFKHACINYDGFN